jgi:hypothetical protein
MKSNIYFIAALLAMLLAATGLNGQTITGYSELFTFDMRIWVLTIEVNPPEGGTVSGGGNYLKWKPVFVEAIPSPGNNFQNWTHNNEEASTSAGFVFIMPGENALLSANFAIPLSSQLLEIPLGWSGVSSYTNPLDNNIEEMFSPILSDLIILQSETGMYWPAQNTNTILNWNTHEGYKIKVANAVELTISGSRETNRTLQLSAGWNLIPVLSECAVDVEALFAGEDLVMVKDVAGWNLYWPEYGINTMGGLLPGKAYFVMMDSAGEIVYPECDGMKGYLTEFAGRTLTRFETLSGLAANWPTTQPTTSTHSVAVPAGVAGELFQTGDIIGVFDQQSNCSGLGIWQGESAAVTLFGNDPTTDVKDGFTEGEPLQFRLYRPDSGEEFDLEVTFDQSLPNTEPVFATNGLSAISEIKMSATGISQSGSEHQIRIIPNPAKDEFLLSIGQDIAVPGRLTIYKLDGQKMGVEPILNQQTNVDISLLPSGVYLLQIEINGSLFTKRLIKN